MLDTEKEQQVGDLILDPAQAPCPHGYIILFFANHFRRIEMSDEKSKDSLDDLLEDHIPKNFVSGGTVSLQDLGRSVKTVLREHIVRVEDVEKERHDPVCEDGCN